MPTYQFDVLIVGGGLAGLSLALNIPAHKTVCLVTKGDVSDTASAWAQGGIAVAMADDDSIQAHLEDTLSVGSGLCDEKAVQYILTQSRQAIDWLIAQGVAFTRSDASHYHLTQEGGHRHRRIMHVADSTGQAIQASLLQQVQSAQNITLLTQHLVLDVITSHKLSHKTENRCLGAYVLDKTLNRVSTLSAQHTVLATGGIGKVYLYTSNPDVSTGDGVAMAWRAGCRVANMEFIQFHPTCLFHPHAKSFLISETVRGEGGILRLPNGYRFMPNYDARAELAPRDVVAQAIDCEMKKHGVDCVFLDVTHLDCSFIKTRFPTIYQRCLSLGIDICQQAIPVVPATHYSCGGIMTDLHGRTDIACLYAVGESAYTGLHGANRLASNSLLECLVMGLATAKTIRQAPDYPALKLPDWDESRVTSADEEVIISHNWDELRRVMWNYVGIVRSKQRLGLAMRRIDMLREEVAMFYSQFKISSHLIELRNLLQVAELIVRSAMLRQESRGLHISRDYPTSYSQAKPTILDPQEKSQ